jgi:hypothetical protein
MYKNFNHQKEVLLTKDYNDTFGAGSTGIIRAWLLPDDHDVISIEFIRMFSKVPAPQVPFGNWLTFKFQEGQDFLNDYCEAPETEEEYLELCGRLGWIIPTENTGE